MGLYDLLEFSFCGIPGVVTLLASLNLLNYMFRWTSWGLEVTISVGFAGLLSHGWRLVDGDGRLKELVPGFLLGKAWESVQQRADARDQSETASLMKLQDPGVDEQADFPSTGVDAGLLASLHASHGGDVLPNCAVPVDFTRADVELANTLTELAARATALTEMAAQAQLRVRRGRRTSSRGECPVPGNLGDIPRGTSLGLDSERPAPRPPGVTLARPMATATDGYTRVAQRTEL
ncbi:hypothetical protein ON010_g16805 [Phytophthora cinnamomi]|nr:hypothetical protein ON010_g16805 [Phytophthora cinnamomi]